MKQNFCNMFKFGSLKALRYKADTISWFFADLALYGSLFLTYLLLMQRFDNINAYSRVQMLLYISTYSLINNFFAVFFSEATSAYGDKIISGEIFHYMLMPFSPTRVILLFNFNLKALISTPFLISVNIFLIRLNEAAPYLKMLYYLSILFASFCMYAFFTLLNTFLFYGIRIESLQGVIVQLFSIAEKPDSIFSPFFRNIFIYLIPAFLFSAVPASIIIKQRFSFEVLYLFAAPVPIWTIAKLLSRHAAKHYRVDM